MPPTPGGSRLPCPPEPGPLSPGGGNPSPRGRGPALGQEWKRRPMSPARAGRPHALRTGLHSAPRARLTERVRVLALYPRRVRGGTRRPEPPQPQQRRENGASQGCRRIKPERGRLLPAPAQAVRPQQAAVRRWGCPGSRQTPYVYTENHDTPLTPAAPPPPPTHSGQTCKTRVPVATAQPGPRPRSSLRKDQCCQAQ